MMRGLLAIHREAHTLKKGMAAVAAGSIRQQPKRRRRRLRRALTPLLLLVATLLVGSVGQASAHARDRVFVPVTIHVATQSGRSVVSEQHIRESVRRANAELAAFDVELVIARIVPMRGGSQLETQDQRFNLGRRADPDGSIHVFFVDRVKLDNPRKGDRRVSGMHWRYHGLDRDIRGREYVAVAHNAPTTTFVHEVGHAFGLTHDKSTDNLMCSCRRGLSPAFTDHQGRRLRHGAKRFLRRTQARAARADRRRARRGS